LGVEAGYALITVSAGKSSRISHSFKIKQLASSVQAFAFEGSDRRPIQAAARSQQKLERNISDC